MSTRTKSDQYMNGWKVGKIVSGKIYRNDLPKKRKSRIEKFTLRKVIERLVNSFKLIES